LDRRDIDDAAVGRNTEVDGRRRRAERLPPSIKCLETPLERVSPDGEWLPFTSNRTRVAQSATKTSRVAAAAV